MKTLFTILILTLTQFSFSQIEISKDLAEGKMGNADWRIVENSKDGKTMKFFYLSYRNQEYTHIIDIGSIMFTDTSQLNNFINLLTQFSELPSKTTASAEFESAVGKGRVYVYDFSTAIYISDKDGKYITITKKAALKFIEGIKPSVDLLLD